MGALGPPDNQVGGWYGLRMGLRGRFGVYAPPVLEAPDLAEVEKPPRDNRMKALRTWQTCRPSR